jgi:N-acetylmuramoyl-L-alanine amidase
VKKNLSILFTVTILLFSSFSPLDEHQYKVRTIVIDAGHGGKDPGCHGTTGIEAKVTLAVALELGRIIKENMPETKVYYTRMTDNFIELHDRAGIANRNNADLFVSIHCNSGPSSAFGTESYVMGLHASEDNLEVAKRENEVVLKETDYKKNYDGFDPKSPQAHILFSLYQNAYIENSILMASKIEHQFSARVGRTSRGVKQAGFLVLWKTTMPSVLIELGYLTNATEEKYLTNKSNQVLLASGIYRAIKEYKTEIEN